MNDLQQSPGQHPSPVVEWDLNVARRALDELFSQARKYKTTTEYYELLKFVGQFRFYSPFNAMLIHTQMPGARFVAPAYRWLDHYHRRIKPGARPLVILQPMGPVMFVFDVSNTEPENGAPPLPHEVEHPFEVRRGRVGSELQRTIENAKRDGIDVHEQQAGSQRAGEIGVAKGESYVEILVKKKPLPTFERVRVWYELLLNSKLSAEAKYATLVHELGHLYCGHLGTTNDKWWPDRRGLMNEVCEFEAESVCYLLCSRIGIDNPSEEYLSDYFRKQNEIPEISLECVVKFAGLIEQMGRGRLPPRKERE